MIRFLRGLASAFLFTLFGFGALYVRYCIFPFQKTKMENYETLQKSWIFFINLMKKLRIIEIKTSNLEKIKNIKNSIIVSTHPSFLDIVILMSIIPHSTCFVAERLSENVFFKGMVKLLFVIEGQPVEDMLKEVNSKFEEGLNLIIFPMGIRHRKNEYPKIRRGAALIAQNTGKNIVMLNLEESFDFLQINQPFYDIGKEPVIYNLDYLGEIQTKEYVEQYQDDVTIKTEITKEITKTLYKDKKIC